MGAEIVVAVTEEPSRRRIEATPRADEGARWEFSVWRDLGDGEPRIRDVDAAARLGFGRPRDVRKLIERIWHENQRPHVRATVSRTSMPRGGEREVAVDEYWLTEAQLLKLCARAATPIADAILDDMIAVYLATRRHLAAALELPAPVPAAPAPPTARVDCAPVILRAFTVRVPEPVAAFYAERAQRLGLSRGFGPEFAMQQVLAGAMHLAIGMGAA